MDRHCIAYRTVLLALAVVAAVASFSCGNSASGMGMGVSAPTRWGNPGLPPTFVGGPVY